MSSDSLAAHFERIEIFQGLSAQQLTDIVRHSERIVYRPGQHLIDAGQAGEAAILVVNGQARQTAGPGASSDAPASIEQGSLVGEMAMLIETEHSSTIVAETEVRALKINRQDLLAQMHDDPTVAEHFVSKIAARLHKIAGELRQIDEILAGTMPVPPTQQASSINQVPAV